MDVERAKGGAEAGNCNPRRWRRRRRRQRLSAVNKGTVYVHGITVESQQPRHSQASFKHPGCARQRSLRVTNLEAIAVPFRRLEQQGDFLRSRRAGLQFVQRRLESAQQRCGAYQVEDDRFGQSSRGRALYQPFKSGSRFVQLAVVDEADCEIVDDHNLQADVLDRVERLQSVNDGRPVALGRVEQSLGQHLQRLGCSWMAEQGVKALPSRCEARSHQVDG